MALQCIHSCSCGEKDESIVLSRADEKTDRKIDGKTDGKTDEEAVDDDGRSRVDVWPQLASTVMAG